MRPVRTFEELDRRATPMGEISLRRRLDPVTGAEVYEAKLDDEFLMSSLFTAAEIALASLSLDAVRGDELDVVVGGLGLGYTAVAVLDDPRVRSLTVVEALPEVIDWHRRGLLPLSSMLTDDARCRLVAADFFAGVEDGWGGVTDPHAVLVDIDHAPDRLLHPSHAAFYEPEGLRVLAGRLASGGIFGLWSDDLPDARFTAAIEAAFTTCEAHVVTFANPYTGGESSNTVYVAAS
jgi:spermidine synthase